jgi:hypothetical protein
MMKKYVVPTPLSELLVPAAFAVAVASLPPTYPDAARVVGYGPFSVIHKEGLLSQQCAH